LDGEQRAPGAGGRELQRRVECWVSHGEVQTRWWRWWSVYCSELAMPEYSTRRTQRWLCVSVKNRARATGLYRAGKEAGQGGSGCRLEQTCSAAKCSKCCN
jgi:uncharacterized protein YaeQ